MGKTCKIGMLIGRFYPYQAGAESQCRLLANELIGRNQEVFVLTQKLPGLKSYEKIGKIPVFRIGLPIKGRLGSFFYLIHGFFWLLTNSNRFDVLHAHIASSPAILAGIVSKILRKPSLVKIACSRQAGDIETSSSTWYGRIKLMILRKTVDNFICLSKETRQEIINAKFPIDKITTIPNGVDTSKFCPALPKDKESIRQSLGLPKDGVFAVYVARLEAHKGLKLLLDIWGEIENTTGNASPYLIVLGRGSLAGYVEDKARSCSSIHFYGWKDEVIQYLRASNIFVLPSFSEGLPNSLLEAMSCGLACISTNIGGISEIIINKQNGILIPPNDISALLDALKGLVADPILMERLGHSSRDFVVRNLNLSNVAEQYIHLYNNVTKISV